VRRRALCLGLAAGLLGLASPRSAAAAPPRVEVELGQSRARVGESVPLRILVTAEGDGQVGAPELGALDGIEMIEQGSSFQSSMSFGTGQTMVRTSTQTYDYLLVPMRPGRWEISVSVGIGPRAVKPSQVPVLEVTGEAATTPEPEPAQTGARPSSAQAEVFLWPTVDKDTVYVGEPILYRFEIWERTNADVQLRSMPAFDDFWVEELEAGRRRRDLVEGVAYRVHPLLERVLFPQKAGRLSIGGGEVAVTPFGGLGLFRPQRRRAPYRVPGSPISVEVRPLPVEGRPAGFSPNNVGRFAIRAQVDRTTLRQGEAFTLTVTVEGTGNLRFLDPGKWPDLRGLRRYDPSEEVELSVEGGEVGGRRSFRFLVVAEDPGAREIPAHELSYFDPASAAYAVARSEPIRIDVVPDPKARAAKAPGLEGAAGDGGEELLADIFASSTLPRTPAREPWLTPVRWTTGVLGVPGVLAASVAARVVVRRVLGDGRTRRRAEQLARRRSLVARARAAVSTGEGFHTALAELVHGVAVERAGAAGVGLSREPLLALLRGCGVPASELQTLRAVLDACDAARFGSAAADPSSREALLERALALVVGPAWRPGGDACGAVFGSGWRSWPRCLRVPPAATRSTTRSPAATSSRRRATGKARSRSTSRLAACCPHAARCFPTTSGRPMPTPARPAARSSTCAAPFIPRPARPTSSPKPRAVTSASSSGGSNPKPPARPRRPHRPRADGSGSGWRSPGR
jgi:hypothetical protein